MVTLILTACAPSESEIVGRWESGERAVVVFADDGTFTATGLGPHLRVIAAEREDVPDDLAAFRLIGRGPDGILAVPTHQGDSSPAYLDFVLD